VQKIFRKKSPSSLLFTIIVHFVMHDNDFGAPEQDVVGDDFVGVGELHLAVALEFAIDLQRLQGPLSQDLVDDFPDLGVGELGAAEDAHFVKNFLFDLFFFDAAAEILNGHQGGQDQDAEDQQAGYGYFSLLHAHFPPLFFYPKWTMLKPEFF
jgi:hypothetical protein